VPDRPAPRKPSQREKNHISLCKERDASGETCEGASARALAGLRARVLTPCVSFDPTGLREGRHCFTAKTRSARGGIARSTVSFCVYADLTSYSERPAARRPLDLTRRILADPRRRRRSIARRESILAMCSGHALQAEAVPGASWRRSDGRPSWDRCGEEKKGIYSVTTYLLAFRQLGLHAG
jgi:hypothetical protein